MSAALTKKVQELADELVGKSASDEEFLEKAKKIESIKKFKIKDYDTALLQLTNHELSLYKEKETSGRIIDKKEIDALEAGKKLLEKAKDFRRDANRKTSKVDTNILTASPFFVGGSKKLKKEGKEQGYLTFEHNGLRRMTYHNDLGLLLTYNDAKTLFNLFDIWEEQGKEEWLTFTEYQLLDKMNMGFGGKQYQILRESLEKIRNTSVVLQEAFDISLGKRFVTERFNLIIADKFTLDTDENGRVRSKNYQIKFSPYIYKSIKEDDHYSLISLALWDELDTDAAKAIYSMMSGISSMESNEMYLKDGGVFEIPVNTVYQHLKLENPKPVKNKMTVEAACNELKAIEIIDDFYFKGVGRRPTSLVIEPSKWLMGVITKTMHKDLLNNNEQLRINFPDSDKRDG